MDFSKLVQENKKVCSAFLPMAAYFQQSPTLGYGLIGEKPPLKIVRQDCFGGIHLIEDEFLLETEKMVLDSAQKTTLYDEVFSMGTLSTDHRIVKIYGVNAEDAGGIISLFSHETIVSKFNGIPHAPEIMADKVDSLQKSCRLHDFIYTSEFEKILGEELLTVLSQHFANRPLAASDVVLRSIAPKF